MGNKGGDRKSLLEGVFIITSIFSISGHVPVVWACLQHVGRILWVLPVQVPGLNPCMDVVDGMCRIFSCDSLLGDGAKAPKAQMPMGLSSTLTAQLSACHVL